MNLRFSGKKEKITMRREAFIYTWSTEDVENEDESSFSIRMYGMDAEHRNVCIHVKDFMPYFLVELEDADEITIQSGQSLIFSKLLTMLGKHEQDECRKKGVNCSFCWRGKMERVSGLKKLYFHHEQNSFSFLKIFFPNNIQRKRAYYRLQEKEMFVLDRRFKVMVHENEANPVLQFNTQQKLPSSGWIRWSKNIEADRRISKQTLCQREVFRSFSSIEPLLMEEEKNPPSPYVLSFDIEVYSSNPNRMPDAEIDTDVVFQVSLVFSRDNVSCKEYLLSLGSPIQSMVGSQVRIRTFPEEASLLVGFTKLVQEENPNVIIGYNIFGFDIGYMITRAKKHNVMHLFDQMSMRVQNAKGKAVHAPEKEISWSSSAYSHQKFFFLDAEGRLFVDLLPVVRRDYKFENYRLKTVSEFFIGETKDPITPKDIFASYERSLQPTKTRFHLLSRVGKYCVQDSRLVLRLFDRIQTWIGLCEMAKTCRVPILSLYTQGQQIRVFSQLYYECFHEKITVQSPHSLGKGAKYIEGPDHYSGAMVFPPEPGVYDWIIPFDFSSLYPSTIIAYNLDFSTLVLDQNIPDDKCHVIEWWDHIGCEHDTTVHATKPKSIVCQKFKYRFLKEPAGVLPRLLVALLDARKKTKAQIKAVAKQLETGGLSPEEESRLETLCQVYDKRQLAYKVSANSMYGSMGVTRGYLPFFPGAMCTTAMGRYNIKKAADFVRTNFQGKIIYGDTDSIYCHFPLKAPREIYAMELWKHAKNIEKELLKIFPPPMKLVFEEKIYKKFLILTKKRYMALTCDHKGEDEDVLTIRGVLLARRDNARWVRSVYEKVVRAVMAGHTLNDLLGSLNNDLLDLFRVSVPLKMLIISKTLGKDYAIRELPEDEKKKKKRLADLGIDESNPKWRDEYESKSKPAHVQLAEKMKRRGVVVEAGSRIEFVIVSHPNKKPKQFERIEDPTYIREHGDLVRPDPLYYAQNLINPVEQILSVCFKKEKLFDQMVSIHQHFKECMKELLLVMNPVYFENETGDVLFETSVKQPKKKKKQQEKITKTTTSTKKSEKKPTTKKKVSTLQLAKDLLA